MELALNIFRFLHAFGANGPVSSYFANSHHPALFREREHIHTYLAVHVLPAQSAVIKRERVNRFWGVAACDLWPSRLRKTNWKVCKSFACWFCYNVKSLGVRRREIVRNKWSRRDNLTWISSNSLLGGGFAAAQSRRNISCKICCCCNDSIEFSGNKRARLITKWSKTQQQLPCFICNEQIMYRVLFIPLIKYVADGKLRPEILHDIKIFSS